MPTLRKFGSEKQETENCTIELVKSYRCVRCQGQAFSHLTTIRQPDELSKNLVSEPFANVSISLVCTSCKRTSVVHLPIGAGTVLHMSGGDGTSTNVSLYKPSSKVTRSTAPSRSRERKSTPKKNSRKKVVSYSRIGKGKRK